MRATASFDTAEDIAREVRACVTLAISDAATLAFPHEDSDGEIHMPAAVVVDLSTLAEALDESEVADMLADMLADDSPVARELMECRRNFRPHWPQGEWRTWYVDAWPLTVNGYTATVGAEFQQN